MSRKSAKDAIIPTRYKNTNLLIVTVTRSCIRIQYKYGLKSTHLLSPSTDFSEGNRLTSFHET